MLNNIHIPKHIPINKVKHSSPIHKAFYVKKLFMFFFYYLFIIFSNLNYNGKTVPEKVPVAIKQVFVLA